MNAAEVKPRIEGAVLAKRGGPVWGEGEAQLNDCPHLSFSSAAAPHASTSASEL